MNIPNDHPQAYRTIPVATGVANYAATNYSHPFYYQRKEEYPMQSGAQQQHYAKAQVPPAGYDRYYSSYYGDQANRQPHYAPGYGFAFDPSYEQYMNSQQIVGGVPKGYPGPYPCYPASVPAANLPEGDKHAAVYPTPISPVDISPAIGDAYQAGSDNPEEGGIFSLHHISGYVSYLLEECLQEIDHVAMCMYKGRQRDRSSNSLSEAGSHKGKDKKEEEDHHPTPRLKSAGAALASKADEKAGKSGSDNFVCPYSWCRKLRSEIWHNSTCCDYNCNICSIIKPLIFLHSATCKLNPCPIQKCQEYKYIVSKYKDIALEEATSPLSYFIFACSKLTHECSGEKRGPDMLFDNEKDSILAKEDEERSKKRKTKSYANDDLYPFPKYDRAIEASHVLHGGNASSSMISAPGASSSALPSATGSSASNNTDSDTDANNYNANTSSSAINNISLSTKRRKSGYIYVTCIKCGKRRGIPNTLNPSYVTKFTCNMNIWDPEYRSCDKEEHIYKDNEPYVDISLRCKDYSKYYRAFIDELQYFIFYIDNKDNNSNKLKNRAQSIDMDTSSENPDRKYSANGTGSNPGSAIQSRHNSVSSLGPQGASASGSAATASAGSQAVLTAGNTQRRDILKIPTFGRREVDLYRLFREVCAYGGCEAVVAREGTWAYIYRSLDNYSPTETSASFRLKKMYSKYLLAYEKYIYNFPPPSSFKRGRGRGASLHYTTPVYTNKSVENASIQHSRSNSASEPSTATGTTATASPSHPPTSAGRERSLSLEEMPESRDKDTLKALLSLKAALSPKAKPKSSPKWEALLNATIKSEDISSQMNSKARSRENSVSRVESHPNSMDKSVPPAATTEEEKVVHTATINANTNANPPAPKNEKEEEGKSEEVAVKQEGEKESTSPENDNDKNTLLNNELSPLPSS